MSLDYGPLGKTIDGGKDSGLITITLSQQLLNELCTSEYKALMEEGLYFFGTKQ